MVLCRNPRHLWRGGSQLENNKHMQQQLSIIINSYNGDQYLQAVLDRFYAFDDIVLLDNYSTDNTIAIAQKYHNVRIFYSVYLGMGALRNLAFSYAKYDWGLFVDCDEIFSCELTEYLLSMQLLSGNIYSILRDNYYNNYKVTTSGWNNDWVLRIYNRQETQYNDNKIHESIERKNLHIVKITAGKISHFPYVNSNELIIKLQNYSTQYAVDKVVKLAKNSVSLWFIMLRFIVAFIKFYFIKLGFLDGAHGFIISSYNAFGVFAKYIKCYELQHKSNIILILHIDAVASFDYFAFINNFNKQQQLPHQIIITLNESDIEANKNHISSQLQNTLIIFNELIVTTESALINILQSDKDDKIIRLSQTKLYLLNNTKFIHHK